MALGRGVQELKHGDHIGRVLEVEHSLNRFKDHLVLVTVEVLARDQITNVVPSIVIKEQAAKHARLGFDRVRRDPQAQSGFGIE